MESGGIDGPVFFFVEMEAKVAQSLEEAKQILAQYRRSGLFLFTHILLLPKLALKTYAGYSSIERWDVSSSSTQPSSSQLIPPRPGTFLVGPAL
ncbi:hypothetical protein ACFL0Q_06935 [Thermodesulfobacteriota bacterium]